jgi:hypothetical protein
MPAGFAVSGSEVFAPASLRAVSAWQKAPFAGLSPHQKISVPAAGGDPVRQPGGGSSEPGQKSGLPVLNHWRGPSATQIPVPGGWGFERWALRVARI